MASRPPSIQMPSNPLRPSNNNSSSNPLRPSIHNYFSNPLKLMNNNNKPSTPLSPLNDNRLLFSPKKSQTKTFLSLPKYGIDWAKCCICQKLTNEKLICPADNLNKITVGAGYQTLSENLSEFQKIGALTGNLHLLLEDKENDTSDFLLEKQAKWHKKCALRYNKNELERARKRKFSSSSANTSSDSNSSFLNTSSDGNSPFSSFLEERKPKRSRDTNSVMADICFICKQEGNSRCPLVKVESLQDEKLKTCAVVTNNLELKAFLEGGDLIAKRAMYHKKCYTNLTNCLRKLPLNSQQQKDFDCENMAFAAVTRFVREKLDATETLNGKFILGMSILNSLYLKHLSNSIGLSSTDHLNTHTTRLRERLLEHFPELKAELSGREYVLYRRGAAIFQQPDNFNNEMVSTKKFLKQVRKDMSEVSVSFNGSLVGSKKVESVPSSLLTLVNFLLYGHAETENTNSATLPAETISQLILFNYQERTPKGQFVRHKKSCEPEIPVYIGLTLYAKMRNNTMIEHLHERGLSISPDRVREITAGFGHMTVERAKNEGVVCPPNLLHGLFTVSAYDNIDHNYSSTTSDSSFHGTAISIFQIPGANDEGSPRVFVPDASILKQNNKKIPELPDSYSVVKTITVQNKEPSYPKADQETCKLLTSIGQGSHWKKEEKWLKHSLTNRKDGPIDISWAAYHAANGSVPSKIALSSLLPLFNESSSSFPMLKHALDQIKKITEFLNPGQVPVVCLDQPLFALLKIIQWNWPEIYGERKFVAMFAHFHIEQAFLKVLGQIVMDSGWVNIVSISGIKTEAGAEACLKVHHVTKARAIHQKTAAVLYNLLIEAFNNQCTPLTFDGWVERRKAECPTFRYWLMVLDLEILLLCFVRSLRTGDYILFTETLKYMVAWFFLTDHTHYARWLPVHLKDLAELERTAPGVHENFCNGQFVVRKSNRPFSALAIDQAHEQNNIIIKDSGGAIGLVQDATMLRRWMLSGPQLGIILEEFESNIQPENTKNLGHHEQYSAHQRKFQEDKEALKASFLEFGNPFEEQSAELLVWDTKVVMDAERIDTLVKAEERANSLYQEYVKDRLGPEKNISVFAPIKKTGTKIFSLSQKKKSSAKVFDLKNDVQLFSRAFIVSSNRNLDLDKFFEYENASAPPSLSSNGDLRTSQKSQLMTILEEIVEFSKFEGGCDSIIYDGPALVHAIPPKTSQTFGEYCDKEFKNKIVADIQRFQAPKLHLVWDTYSETSLKNFVREKRGSGTRRKVAAGNVLPKNWNDFLLCDDNKTELFHLLGEYSLSNLETVHVLTEISGVICSTCNEQTSLQNLQCKQDEEADSRIFLHANDSINHGAKKILIQTVDTDVVVLAVSYFPDFEKAGLKELWILFGVGKNQRYINIGAISRNIGEDKSIALRGFHAFSGSDVTSSFASKGKPSAWKTWKSFPEATKAFKYLSFPCPDNTLPDDIFELLEKYVIHLYYSNSDESSVDKVRKMLFTSKNRSLQNLPPTRGALKQHCLRAAYLAGQVWGRACSKNDKIPEPEGWGWQRIAGKWKPVWSSLPCIWEACRELVKCGCTSGCKKNCSCVKAKVPCTLLCSHFSKNAECENKYSKSDEFAEEE